MKEHFNNYVQNLETYIMFKIKQEAAELTPELKEKNRTPIYLSMGAPTTMPPEFVQKTLINAINMPNNHTYSSPKGEGYLLDAIATRMRNKYGVELNTKNEIFSLIGSKEGIANFIRMLINPTTVKADKDIILIPDPGYASYGEMIKVSGGLGYPVPLLKSNNYMPDLEEVRKNLINDGYSFDKVKALIINYPNNPLGAVATVEYLKKTVEFCKRYNIILISDAAYVDMTFENEPKCHSILEFENAKDVAIEFYSFSKPYSMTGWRIGWCCGNSELVSGLGKLKSTIDSGIYKPIQYAASQIINSEDGDKYIVEANKEFEIKQKMVLDGFKDLGWDIEELNPPRATFYLWLPIPKKYKKSEDFTKDVLKTSGVVLVPGTAFGHNGEGYFRMSIVVSREQIKEVINRLKQDGFYFDK